MVRDTTNIDISEYPDHSSQLGKNERPSRILVIDDDDDTRETVCNIFTHFGYEVESARNGADGLRLFQDSRHDVVVTDILMPEKEGIETIRELRLLSPHLKIIAMSGGGTRSNFSYLEMAKSLGADSALQKPFLPAQLAEAVADLIG